MKNHQRIIIFYIYNLPHKSKTIITDDIKNLRKKEIQVELKSIMQNAFFYTYIYIYFARIVAKEKKKNKEENSR